jgi:hypothetical protein
MDVVSNIWDNAPLDNDSALRIMGKFKCTRYELKKWIKNLSNLNKIIQSCSYTLALLDGLEEQTNLST